MRQHAVDDRLREERRQEAEALQEERDEEHLDEEALVLRHDGEEPTEAEGLDLVRQLFKAEALRKEDDFARKVFRERDLVGKALLPYGRIEDQRLPLVIEAAAEHVVAIFHAADKRSRHLREMRGLNAVKAARAQADVARRAQQADGIDAFLVHDIGARELAVVRRDLEMRRDVDEARKSGIDLCHITAPSVLRLCICGTDRGRSR